MAARASAQWWIRGDRVRSAPGVLFAVTVLVVAGADQAGKAWATARFGSTHGSRGSLGPLLLELTRNPGASFGLAAGLTPWITLVTLGAVGGLVYLGLRARTPAWAVALGLIAGGGLGNGIDRIARAPGPFHGAVVDWIKLPFYGPVFNLADVSLRTGVLIALVLLLRGTRARPTGPVARPPADEAGSDRPSQTRRAGIKADDHLE